MSSKQFLEKIIDVKNRYMFQPLRDEILIALRRDIFDVIQNFIKENNIEYDPLNAFKLNIINNEISIYFDENFQRILINYWLSF